MYRDYVITDKKGDKMLCVRMSKALYGLLKSALDFYNKLRSELEDNGFIVNPYDPCVANKDVNGKQILRGSLLFNIFLSPKIAISHSVLAI